MSTLTTSIQIILEALAGTKWKGKEKACRSEPKTKLCLGVDDMMVYIEHPRESKKYNNSNKITPRTNKWVQQEHKDTWSNTQKYFYIPAINNMKIKLNIFHS